MFSLLNNSNNIDLTQGKTYLNINKNQEKELLPNLNLINTNINTSPLIENMSNSNYNESGDKKILENNVNHLNNEFNLILSEFKENLKLAMQQGTDYLNNNKKFSKIYGGKNVKINNTNDYYYINEYGFKQKYRDYNSKPDSCNLETLTISAEIIRNFPDGNDLGKGVECGLAGKNVQNKSTGQYSWIDQGGVRRDYRNKISWENRNESCKNVPLLQVSSSNLSGLISHENKHPDSMCYTFRGVEYKLLKNIEILKSKLDRLGKELLIEISKLLLVDIENEIVINNLQNEINKKLADIQYDFEVIANGEFDAIEKYNPNIQELRTNTELSATSNFTRYLVFLFLLVLVIAIIVITYITNNSKIGIFGIIITAFYILIMTYSNHFSVNF
tara:strand:- start:873 stop:2036 length:1164 start_codon:yes stop_codon:yes gene_type:complete